MPITATSGWRLKLWLQASGLTVLCSVLVRRLRRRTLPRGNPMVLVGICPRFQRMAPRRNMRRGLRCGIYHFRRFDSVAGFAFVSRRGNKWTATAYPCPARLSGGARSGGSAATSFKASGSGQTPSLRAVRGLLALNASGEGNSSTAKL